TRAGAANAQFALRFPFVHVRRVAGNREVDGGRLLEVPFGQRVGGCAGKERPQRVRVDGAVDGGAEVSGQLHRVRGDLAGVVAHERVAQIPAAAIPRKARGGGVEDDRFERKLLESGAAQQLELRSVVAAVGIARNL